MQSAIDTTEPRSSTDAETDSSDAFFHHEGDSTTAGEQCPECGGTLVSEEGHECVCQNCRLVARDQQLDRGPDWRAFSEDGRHKKRHVGPAVDRLKHDKGLSTQIDWRNKDSQGQTLSSKKRQRLKRLRTWNERFRVRDAQDRNLKQALSEIERMGSALGLSTQVRETASVIYRRALETDLLPGRSIEGVATAALYAAARQMECPRTMSDLSSVSRVSKTRWNRAYRCIVRELGLEIRPVSPLEYVERTINSIVDNRRTALEQDNPETAPLWGEKEHPDKFDASRLEARTRKIIETATEQNYHSDVSPISIVAGAVYVAGLVEDIKVSQSELADATNTSTVTIRTHYHSPLHGFEISSDLSYTGH